MNDARKFKAPYKKQFVSRKQYSHFKTLGAAPLPVFPRTLLAPYYIDVQNGNSCTGFSGVKERYGVTGARYDGDKQYQAELKFLNMPPAYVGGVDLDTKMQVGLARNFGFVPVGFTDPTDGARAYFWVQQLSGYDWFDSVRLAIYQLYQKYGKVIPVTIGVNWYDEWDHTPNGILGMNGGTVLGGHDIEIAGIETYSLDNVDYIVLAGTWGEGFGDQGIFRVPRSVFNKFFAGYGCAYWSDDATLPVAKMNALVALLQNLVVLYKRLIAKKNGFPPPPTPVPPPPPAPPTPTYLWDTAANAQHSIRVICDEEGLTFNMQYGLASTKNILLACIQIESGFMNYRPDGTPVKHNNLGMNSIVTSTDWGICQVNDYFHIGAGKDFPSVEYVLANPEKCVRWMAKLFMAGKASLWSSYKGGGFKKFLP